MSVLETTLPDAPLPRSGEGVGGGGLSRRRIAGLARGLARNVTNGAGPGTALLASEFLGEAVVVLADDLEEVGEQGLLMSEGGIAEGGEGGFVRGLGKGGTQVGQAETGGAGKGLAEGEIGEAGEEGAEQHLLGVGVNDAGWTGGRGPRRHAGGISRFAAAARAEEGWETRAGTAVREGAQIVPRLIENLGIDDRGREDVGCRQPLVGVGPAEAEGLAEVGTDAAIPGGLIVEGREVAGDGRFGEGADGAAIASEGVAQVVVGLAPVRAGFSGHSYPFTLPAVSPAMNWRERSR